MFQISMYLIFCVAWNKIVINTWLFYLGPLASLSFPHSWRKCSDSDAWWNHGHSQWSVCWTQNLIKRILINNCIIKVLMVQNSGGFHFNTEISCNKVKPFFLMLIASFTSFLKVIHILVINIFLQNNDVVVTFQIVFFMHACTWNLVLIPSR